MDDAPLTDAQLEAFGRVLHAGAAEASTALAAWIGRPAVILSDAVEQLAIDEAAGVLGDGDEPIGFCEVELTGILTGCMVLAFDDPSGLALADLLLSQERGTARTWGEMETSAALETTNILCCSYLNALSRMLPDVRGPGAHDHDLVPTPPRFSHDYPTSLLEFALLGQIAVQERVLLARTSFQIDDQPVDWRLLFIPDAASLATLRARFAAGTDGA